MFSEADILVQNLVLQEWINCTLSGMIHLEKDTIPLTRENIIQLVDMIAGLNRINNEQSAIIADMRKTQSAFYTTFLYPSKK